MALADLVDLAEAHACPAEDGLEDELEDDLAPTGPDVGEAGAKWVPSWRRQDSEG